LQLSECEHSIILQRGGELFGGQSVDLVSAVGDEVEHVAELRKALGESPHLIIGHPRGIPVERGRQVVGQHFSRIDRVNGLGKTLCVRQVRGFGLHPDEVTEGSHGERLGDGIVDSTSNLKVAIRRSC